MSIAVPAGSFTSRVSGCGVAEMTTADCDCWMGFVASVSTTVAWPSAIVGDRKIANNKPEYLSPCQSSCSSWSDARSYRNPGAAENVLASLAKPFDTAMVAGHGGKAW